MTEAIETDLESWLESTQTRRDGLDSFAVSAMPVFEFRERDIEKAIAWGHDAGKLLADAEEFLTKAKAQAMYSALADERLSAKDRDLSIRSSVSGIQRLVDGLGVCNRTIQNRIYATMNARRSTL